MPDLSVIIINWNSKEYLRNCLQSLQKNCELDLQVIVVDNASFDGCGEMLQKRFPTVEFVQGSKNLGFGRANNLGFTHARGDYVLLLNPDTEVRVGALETLLKKIRNDENIGIVGPRLLNSDGSVQECSVHKLPTPINQSLDSMFFRKRFPNSSIWGSEHALTSEESTNVEGLGGACILLRSADFAAVGGFCKAYFMYAEDMHLCWDISKLGKKIVYHPGAEVVHHGGGASSGEFSRFSCVAMQTSLHQFVVYRQGKLAGRLYRMLMAASAVGRIGCLCICVPLADRGRRNMRIGSIKRWGTIFNWACGFASPHPHQAEQAIQAKHSVPQ